MNETRQPDETVNFRLYFKVIIILSDDDFEIKSKIYSLNCLSCFIHILNCKMTSVFGILEFGATLVKLSSEMLPDFDVNSEACCDCFLTMAYLGLYQTRNVLVHCMQVHKQIIFSTFHKEGLNSIQVISADVLKPNKK